MINGSILLLLLKRRGGGRPRLHPMSLFGCDPCGLCCSVFSDPFETDYLTTKYTVVAGSAAVAGGTLNMSAANTVIISDTTGTDQNNHMSWRMLATATGDIGRVMIDYRDASNYHFAEISFGTGGYANLYRRTSGSDTLLGGIAEAPGLDTWVGFTLCIRDNTIVLTGLNTQFSAVGTFTQSAFGFGTGATVTGTVSIDDLRVETVSDDCASCYGCGGCVAGTVPDAFQVDLANIALKSPVSCADCLDMNATYVLPYYRTLAPGGSLAPLCEYRLALDGSICGLTVIQLHLDQGLNSEGYVAIRVLVQSGGFADFGSIAVGPDTDCRTFSGKNIPRTAGGSAFGCNFSAATCQVTAIPSL